MDRSASPSCQQTTTSRQTGPLGSQGLDGAVSLYGVNAARAYQRLVRLGPQDYGALIASTRAFLGLGLESDARAAWALARRADPRQASGDAKREPALAALGE